MRRGVAGGLVYSAGAAVYGVATHLLAISLVALPTG
jgi:hypothetical protein